MTEDQLPLRLWINARQVEEEDGSRSLSTTGLEDFGHREIEIWGWCSAKDVLDRWAFNVAHFLLEKNPTIQDGETVAISQNEWIHVFLQPSMFDPEREVYCLKLDE